MTLRRLSLTRAPLAASLLTAALLAAALLFPFPAGAQEAGAVVISEFAASNTSDTTTDSDGDSSDWIELHNTSGAAVDLGGWRLADDDNAWFLPQTTIAAGDYLIVWASGKNRFGNELHTNFKLKASGEYLGLFNTAGNAQSEFDPFPAQSPDRSYGVGSNGVTGFMVATPGAANGVASQPGAEPPTAAVGRGVYFAAVTESLTTPGGQGVIRYTIDGTEPTSTSTAYSGPITLQPDASGITTLRAKTFVAGAEPSAESTWSYVWPQALYPDHPQTYDDFQNRPVFSIYTDGGETPDHVSRFEMRFDMIDPSDTLDGFDASAAMKVVGDTSVTRIAKKSWRIYFDSDYGQSSLTYPLFEGYGQGFYEPTDEFVRFDLHGGSFDAYQHSRYFLSDRFFKDTQLDMGAIAPHGRYVSVFLNGQFNGVYNMRERADHNFMATYLPGDADEYESGKGFLRRLPVNFGIDMENGNGDVLDAIFNARDYDEVADLVGDPWHFAAFAATEVAATMNQCEIRAGVQFAASTNGALVTNRNDSDGELSGSRSKAGLRGCVYESTVKHWLDEPAFAETLEDALAFGFCPGGPLTQAKMLERLDDWTAEVDGVMDLSSRRYGPSRSQWEGALDVARTRIEAVSDAEVLAGLAEAGQLTSCDRRPVIDFPTTMTSLANRAIAVNVATSDADGHAITIAATGLPAGLTLNPQSGDITGTPSTPGSYSTTITATDSSGDWASVEVAWDILANASTTIGPVALNEYNAVSASAGEWAGTDSAFPDDPSNGGDWFELVVLEDVDLRGYQVELWDRDRVSETLRETHTFVFSDSAVLADVAAGTIITVSEAGSEDLAYAPSGGDWDLNIVAASASTSALLTPGSLGSFDTNRHEWRILVRNPSGQAVSPFMGETETWRALGRNVGAGEVMALCASPNSFDPVSDYLDQATVSTFGEPNRCIVGEAEIHQAFGEIRNLVPGDVDCDGERTVADATALLGVLIGAFDGGGCSQTDVQGANGDLNGDGTLGLVDAQLLARCLADAAVCDS